MRLLCQGRDCTGGSPRRIGGRARREVLAADRPTVLEVKTAAEIAPLPPHLTFKEAKKFMFAMTRDDDAAHGGRVAVQQLRDLGRRQAMRGTPVLAAAGGVVSTVAYVAEYGNIVDVDHDNGLTSRYAHLSRSVVRVSRRSNCGVSVNATAVGDFLSNASNSLYTCARLNSGLMHAFIQ